MQKKFKVLESVDQNGNCPFRDWFNSLDPVTAARAATYVERVVQGNHSNVSPIGSGLSEIKLNYGPGLQDLLWKREGLYSHTVRW